ncbi:MAG TPA: CGNR zinc finger domain-containing protein [Terrimesophilobacter sp.]|nr:CGNR zinc finger domain-containing protein [Terrimesophilobacter sp.]HRQ00898.1 CGNR zinc finger domain-containing protein [Terrimesophilobacter sp.]
MLFAPDTVESLRFAVELVNTHPGASRSGTDELSTPRELMAMVTSVGYTGRFDRDEAELADVVATRQLLHDVWELPRDDAVPIVNRMLSDASAEPFLVRHDGLDWHLHATDASAPLAERIRVEVALALIDMIRSNEWGRLRSCAADDCTGILVDLSRNGSKRYCSVRCSNRVNMVEHRARLADSA